MAVTKPDISFLFSPEFLENPYPFYRQLRENCPLEKFSLSNGEEFWLVTRYRDADHILKSRFFGREVLKIEDKSRQPVPEQHKTILSLFNNMMLSQEPPAHTRLRRIIGNALNSVLEKKNINGIVEHTADKLITELLAKREVDLIRDFAFWLPLFVNAAIMGIPEKDIYRMKKWSDALVSMLDVSLQKKEIRSWVNPVAEEMQSYFMEMIEERKKAAQDDLVSAMLYEEENGQRLSGEEIAANCCIMLVGGHETTIRAIGNGLLAFAVHPVQAELLQSDFQLTDNAVEEVLRYDGPVQFVYRYAYEDMEVSGKKICNGEMVEICLGAANHDPEYFENPEQFSISRKPVFNFAFSAGVHWCIGRTLGRQELKIALEKFFKKIRKTEITGKPVRDPYIAFRGLSSLPARITPC